MDSIDEILENIIKIPDEEGPRNFSWIVKNELAGMACPETIQQLKYLSYKGICHLVTLSEECQPNQIEQYKHLNWLMIPIKEYEPPTIKQIIKFLEFCRNCQENKQAVGIHCRQGWGRTGVLGACYLVYFNNITPERAITTIRLSRPGSIETYRQERIIYEFFDLMRSENFETRLLEILKTTFEHDESEYKDLEGEEKKLELNYFQYETIKKNIKVLDYNSVYIFSQMVNQYLRKQKYRFFNDMIDES